MDSTTIIEPADAGVTMLFRPGTTPNPEAWNLPIDLRIVDSDHIEIALENGWYLHPSDFPATGEAKPAKGAKSRPTEQTAAEPDPAAE